MGARIREDEVAHPVALGLEVGDVVLVRGDLDRDAVDNDHLRPLIDRTMKLEDAAEAHRLIEQGGLKGKIVLTP